MIENLGLKSIDLGWVFWLVYTFLLGFTNEGWDIIAYDPHGIK